MKSNRETVQRLQHQLREKFGSRQSFSGPGREEPCPTAPSIPAGEAIPSYRLRPGKIQEIVTGGGGGAGLALERILAASLPGEGRARAGGHFVFIDGRDGFDPASFGGGSGGGDVSDLFSGMLWVRCRHAGEAMKAADWLVRDGNIPLVILDLRFNPPEELRRIPPSSWHRLRALVEEVDAMFLAFTPEKTLPCSHVRWRLEERFSLAVMEEQRDAIALAPRVERGRK